MKTVKHLSVILALVLVLVATLTVTVFALAPNDEGVYEIGSAEDLIEFAALANGQNYTAKLTADIDMTGKDWAPIKVFKGTFDGDGHVISGIHIEQAFESDGYGFGLLIRDLDQGAATVKNLTLKDCSLTLTADQTGNRNNHIGGVVGWAGKGHFENIHLKNVDVSFTGNTKGQCNVGGIVGMSNSANPATGTISFYNCSVDADSSVKGDTSRAPNVGGIVGNLTGDIQAPAGGYKLDMQNCVNYASVSSNDWAGGMIGSLYSTGENTIANCKNYGVITSTGEAAGALVGSAGNKTLLVKDSIAGGYLIPANKSGAVCGVNGNAVTTENTTESALLAIGVATADEFRAAMIEANVEKNIVLLADIDLGEAGNTTMGGTFTGVFDGQGYTVSGITNTLFNVLSEATVQNVVLEGTITSDNRKAASVAYDTALDTWVTNVTSYVDITSSASNYNAGGIIGYGRSVQFTNVIYAGDYVCNAVDGGQIGGLVGYGRNDKGTETCSYINCAFTGTITVNGSKSGQAPQIGAIAGNIRQGTTTIENFLNLGTITLNTVDGVTNGVSGTVCNNNATTVTITNAVNLGTVIGADDADAVGDGVLSGSTTNTYTGLYNATHATETVESEGATYMAFPGDIFVNVTAGTFVDEMPAIPEPPVTESPETSVTPDEPIVPEEGAFSAGDITETAPGEFTVASDDFSAFLSTKANVVGGKSDLRILLVANYEVLCANEDAVLTVEIGGKTFTKSVVDDLKIYQSAMAAGDLYTATEDCVLFGLVITGIPNDAWEDVKVTLTSSNTTVSGSATMDEAITHAVGAPVPDGIYTGFGIENHHDVTNKTASAIVYFWNADIATEAKDNNYSFKILWNGELLDAPLFGIDGQICRLSLESAGITGIMNGEEYSFEVQLYNADGDLVYYTGMLTFTSKCFSTDIPAQNVELPTEGLKKVTVDTTTLSVKNGAGNDQGFWGDGPVVNLFDGNTAQTKMGCGTDGTVALTFSLTDAATLSYYTIWTGNDTGNQDRNPKAWVLYGKVGEEWVELSKVGYTQPHGMQGEPSTPHNYAITNPTECKEYKIVFETNGSFQLNELMLYKNEAGLGSTNAAALIGDAEVLPFNSRYAINKDTYEITYGIQSRGHYNGTEGLAELTAEGAYAYVRANDGEFVRYEITSLRTEAHYKVHFVLDGFTPEAGVNYEFVVLCVGGQSWKYSGATHALYGWDYTLAQ